MGVMLFLRKSEVEGERKENAGERRRNIRREHDGGG